MYKFIKEYGALVEGYISSGNQLRAKELISGMVDYVINKKVKEFKNKKIKAKLIVDYIPIFNKEWKDTPEHIKEIAVNMLVDEFRRNGYIVD